jgi:hypothetical protein
MAGLAGGVAFGACLLACGGSQITWDLSDAAADGNVAVGSSGGCGTLCTSDQQCQANCMSATRALYCCDLSASIGGMGICYAPPSPATACPGAAGGADAGRRDAGRVVDAGRRGRGGNQMND